MMYKLYINRLEDIDLSWRPKQNDVNVKNIGYNMNDFISDIIGFFYIVGQLRILSSYSYTNEK